MARYNKPRCWFEPLKRQDGVSGGARMTQPGMHSVCWGNQIRVRTGLGNRPPVVVGAEDIMADEPAGRAADQDV